jgi:hypothetical protein
MANCRGNCRGSSFIRVSAEMETRVKFQLTGGKGEDEHREMVPRN